MKIIEAIGIIIIAIFFTVLSAALYFTIQKNIAETKLMEVTTIQIIQQNKELGIQQ